MSSSSRETSSYEYDLSDDSQGDYLDSPSYSVVSVVEMRGISSSGSSSSDYSHYPGIHHTPQHSTHFGGISNFTYHNSPDGSFQNGSLLQHTHPSQGPHPWSLPNSYPINHNIPHGSGVSPIQTALRIFIWLSDNSANCVIRVNSSYTWTQFIETICSKLKLKDQNISSGHVFYKKNGIEVDSIEDLCPDDELTFLPDIPNIKPESIEKFEHRISSKTQSSLAKKATIKPKSPVIQTRNHHDTDGSRPSPVVSKKNSINVFPKMSDLQVYTGTHPHSPKKFSSPPKEAEQPSKTIERSTKHEGTVYLTSIVGGYARKRQFTRNHSTSDISRFGLDEFRSLIVAKSIKELKLSSYKKAYSSFVDYYVSRVFGTKIRKRVHNIDTSEDGIKSTLISLSRSKSEPELHSFSSYPRFPIYKEDVSRVNNVRQTSEGGMPVHRLVRSNTVLMPANPSLLLMMNKTVSSPLMSSIISLETLTKSTSLTLKETKNKKRELLSNPLNISDAVLYQQMKLEEIEDAESTIVSNGTLIGGTIRGMVRHIISNVQDKEIIIGILLTIPLHISHYEFLNILIRLFLVPGTSADALAQTDTSEKKKSSEEVPLRDILNVVIQHRLIRIMTTWIDVTFDSINSDREVTNLFDEFVIYLDSSPNDKYKSYSNRLVSAWKSAKGKRLYVKTQLECARPNIYFHCRPQDNTSFGSTQNLMSSQPFYQSGSTSSNEHSILDFTPLVLAQQLTIGDQDIFGRIGIEEYASFAGKLRHTNMDAYLETVRASTPEEYSEYQPRFTFDPTGKSQSESNPNTPYLSKLMERMNRISYWVATTILTSKPKSEEEKRHRHRGFVINHFIMVMDELRTLNNWCGTIQIYAALNMVCISRLRRSWNYVTARGQAILEEVTNMLATNAKVYRSLIEYAMPPCIPAHDIILRDLTFIEENSSYLDENEILNARHASPPQDDIKHRSQTIRGHESSTDGSYGSSGSSGSIRDQKEKVVTFEAQRSTRPVLKLRKSPKNRNLSKELERYRTLDSDDTHGSHNTKSPNDSDEEPISSKRNSVESNEGFSIDSLPSSLSISSSGSLNNLPGSEIHDSLVAGSPVSLSPKTRPNYINYSKFVLLGKVFKSIKVFQQIPYNFRSNDQIDQWINNSPIYTESELYSCSKRLEPPKSTIPTNIVPQRSSVPNLAIAPIDETSRHTSSTPSSSPKSSPPKKQKRISKQYATLSAAGAAGDLKSLYDIVQNPFWVSKFRTYLESVYAAEVLECYLIITQEYNVATSEETRRSIARQLYDAYISENGLKAISLSSLEKRALIRNHLNSSSPLPATMFKSITEEVEGQLHDHFFPFKQHIQSKK